MDADNVIQIGQLVIGTGAAGFIMRSLWSIPVELKELNVKFGMMLTRLEDHEHRLRKMDDDIKSVKYK